MNDFTKEELINLHGVLDSCIKSYCEPDFIYSLRYKIQSLIDNYCEHQLQNDGLKGDIEFCVKCGRFLKMNPRVRHDNQ